MTKSTSTSLSNNPRTSAVSSQVPQRQQLPPILELPNQQEMYHHPQPQMHDDRQYFPLQHSEPVLATHAPQRQFFNPPTAPAFMTPAGARRQTYTSPRPAPYPSDVSVSRSLGTLHPQSRGRDAPIPLGPSRSPVSRSGTSRGRGSLVSGVVTAGGVGRGVVTPVRGRARLGGFADGLKAHGGGRR